MSVEAWFAADDTAAQAAAEVAAAQAHALEYQRHLEAVRQDGWALEDVPEALKSEALCLEAVWQCVDALTFVPKSLRAAVSAKLR